MSLISLMPFVGSEFLEEKKKLRSSPILIAPHSAHSGYRKLVHITLVLFDPGRVNEPLTGRIQVLVSTADRPVTNVDDL